MQPLKKISHRHPINKCAVRCRKRIKRNPEAALKCREALTSEKMKKCEADRGGRFTLNKKPRPEIFRTGF